MNARAFRDIWARVMFLSLRLVQFENFKSIASDHMSRNARAIIQFFCLKYSEQNYKRIHL